ncbi:hypothetical protein B0H19DRAFT_1386669 [Mycena capillaripes]|nr:hypothetical protein B0H19DRAFT_1386669 [Mycena capillaripes]
MNASTSPSTATSPISSCPSPRPSTSGPGRALSPEDLAPSLFAPSVCLRGALRARACVCPGVGVGGGISALGAGPDGRVAADPIALALASASHSAPCLARTPAFGAVPALLSPQPESVSDTIAASTFSTLLFVVRFYSRRYDFDLPHPPLCWIFFPLRSLFRPSLLISPSSLLCSPSFSYALFSSFASLLFS